MSYRFESLRRQAATVKKEETVSRPITVYVPVAAPGSGMAALPALSPTPEAAQAVPRAVAPGATPVSGALVMNFEEMPGGLSAARAAVKEGRLKDAVGSYVDWLRANPNDAQAWGELGGIYRALGYKNYAIHCYEAVLRLQPGNAQLNSWLESYRSTQAVPLAVSSPTPGASPH